MRLTPLLRPRRFCHDAGHALQTRRVAHGARVTLSAGRENRELRSERPAEARPGSRTTSGRLLLGSVARCLYVSRITTHQLWPAPLYPTAGRSVSASATASSIGNARPCSQHSAKGSSPSALWATLTASS